LITSLYLNYFTMLPPLATLAPQIQHLGICVLQEEWWSMSPDPIFPSLITLTFDGSPGQFPNVYFEPFIRRRCLPITHPQCLLITPEPLESITIRLWRKTRTVYKWKECALFKEAKQTVIEGDEVISISLTWL
jgi:hypothetical protein